jgi:hypothetical protein
VDIFGSSQPVMRPGLDSLNNVYACLHSEEGKEGLDLYSKVRISCFPWKKKTRCECKNVEASLFASS